MTDNIKSLIGKVQFSESGSNQLEKEKATYMLFLDMLHNIEGTNMTCYTGKVRYSDHMIYRFFVFCIPDFEIVPSVILAVYVRTCIQMMCTQTSSLVKCLIFSLEQTIHLLLDLIHL